MDGWSTFPVELKGGLVTDKSLLQQGINLPGSARILRNFEPSIQGGYRLVEGYAKYDTAFVPPKGEPVVQASAQTGTTLNIANIFTTPTDADTFTIAGVSGTYTIATSGVNYNSTNKTATLTITPALATSPADQAAVTFANSTDNIIGVDYYNDNTIAFRNADVHKSSGSGWTRINVPSYGTTLVNGASQTGTSLIVDGFTATPQVGDTFTLASVEQVYTITVAVTLVSGGATLTITPSLASSPADDAVMTFLSTDRDGSSRVETELFDFTGTKKLAIVDGINNPAYYDGSTFTVFDGASSDITGAQHVVSHKDHLFFAKNKVVSFLAPFSTDDDSIANGAGNFNVADTINGLHVFRDQLFIFCEQKILKLSGSSAGDFQVIPVTEDIGCIARDTIQEVGGDVAFLAPDGLRLLSATDRIGDFGLAAVSRKIQSKFVEFQGANTGFCSALIREKSQYRIFGWNANLTDANAQGIIATQFSQQGGEEMDFAELKGFNALCAASRYVSGEEFVLFANNSGFVYRMENGAQDLDGSNIVATFATPHWPIEDSRVRKTFYKVFFYMDPQGSVSFGVNLKLDFDSQGTIQPATINFDNQTQFVAFYGTGVYGVASYGDRLSYVFGTQLVGSGFNGSIQIEYDGNDPAFTLDAMTLEYANNDRR